MNRLLAIVLGASIGGAGAWIAGRAAAADRTTTAQIRNAAQPAVAGAASATNPDPKMVVTPSNPDPNMVITPPNPDPKMAVRPPWPESPTPEPQQGQH